MYNNVKANVENVTDTNVEAINKRLIAATCQRAGETSRKVAFAGVRILHITRILSVINRNTTVIDYKLLLLPAAIASWNRYLKLGVTQKISFLGAVTFSDSLPYMEIVIFLLHACYSCLLPTRLPISFSRRTALFH